MMYKYSSIFLIINVFVFCESAFVDTLPKCEMKDENCHKEFMHTFLKRIAKDGVPELDIPPIDPMIVKNVSVKIMNLIDISLIEGKVKGVKDCVVEKFVKSMKKQRVFLDIICNVTLKGEYKVLAEGPIVESLVGSDLVHGEGNGKIQIVKLQLKIVFPFFLTKRNGDMFLQCKREETQYDFNVLGSMSFSADNLYIGGVESSKLVTGILDNSWQFLVPTFGRPFVDKVMDYVITFVCQFHDKVSTKYYITDDLSCYVE